MTDASKQALDNLRIQNRPAGPCDQRCYDLAMVFLKVHALAYPDYGRELGGEIQELIETWIDAKLENLD